MRILRIIASVDPKGGGLTEAVLQQALQFSKSGNTTEIATLDDPNEAFVRVSPIPVHALGCGPSGRLAQRLPWLHYGYTPRLVPWLRNNLGRYDFVIVDGIWNYSTLAARRTLVRRGKPYAVFVHGMLDPWFKKAQPIKSLIKQVFWWFCEGPLLAQANAVFFTTEEERDLARNVFWPYHAEERLFSLGIEDLAGDPAAQMRSFRARFPTLNSRRYLLFMSRLHPKKGCDLLVEAFAEQCRSDPETDLVIAGPDEVGWRAALEKRAIELGAEKRIHWVGMLGGDEKWGALRGAEAMILPSHSENFGVVVVEALAAGTPVLITNKVNIWREVDEGGGGIVESDDKPGVERLLKRFHQLSQAERDRMRSCARNVFSTRFDVARFSATLNQTLSQAVQS